MKVLLDECVPWPLHTLLTGHACTHVKQHGWGGVKNGELIRRAEGEFDLFITADQNIRYQQNMTGRRIPIIELSTNNLRRIAEATSELLQLIATIQPNEFRILEIP